MTFSADGDCLALSRILLGADFALDPETQPTEVIESLRAEAISTHPDWDPGAPRYVLAHALPQRHTPRSLAALAAAARALEALEEAQRHLDRSLLNLAAAMEQPGADG